MDETRNEAGDTGAAAQGTAKVKAKAKRKSPAKRPRRPDGQRQRPRRPQEGGRRQTRAEEEARFSRGPPARLLEARVEGRREHRFHLRRRPRLREEGDRAGRRRIEVDHRPADARVEEGWTRRSARSLRRRSSRRSPPPRRRSCGLRSRRSRRLVIDSRRVKRTIRTSVSAAGFPALALALALAHGLGAAEPPGTALPPPSAGGIDALDPLLRKLATNRRLLIIAAHPDDEDTALLTLVARGMGGEAAYLSLSRGDGGQNLIGDELGVGLGLIRTEELNAARRLDGARQYFSRAYDFGFSKSIEETFRLWPKEALLEDAVRIIRRFRPQVVVAIFSGTPRDGHGQHQASGIVARGRFTSPETRRRSRTWRRRGSPRGSPRRSTRRPGSSTGTRRRSSCRPAASSP